jgi:hypothetical protein
MNISKECNPNMIEKVLKENYPWWEIQLEKITHPLEIFWERLSRSCCYAKRGWKSYDFDSSYALEDFIWKLNRVAVILDKYKYHTVDEENAQQIKRVTYLLDRINKDEYEECYKELEDKYGNYTFKRDAEGKMFPLRREKETDENTEDCHKMFGEAIQKHEEMRQKEFDEALKIISEHFYEWWN